MALSNAELSFFQNFKNENFLFPINEKHHNEDVIFRDETSSLIFTTEGLYLKYQIKTIEVKEKGNWLFGVSYFFTPKYIGYHLRVKYDSLFFPKLKMLIKLKNHFDKLDKFYPDGLQKSGHKETLGQGGYGLQNWDTEPSPKNIKNIDLIKLDKKDIDKYSIDYVKLLKEKKEEYGSSSEDEICIFDFNVEFCNYFYSYFKNEIINNKDKYVKHADFKLFGLDIERTLKENQTSLINTLDQDKDGLVDLNDCVSLLNILQKNQTKIINLDKSYIQKFVKISTYLRTKKENIQKIFTKIELTKNEKELEIQLYLLKNQINTYDSLLFHSLSMLTSLIEDDLITFYEIYETFDKLGIFNSNWENEVSDKLNDISEGINDLIFMIDKMEQNIVSSINNLTYVTQTSFEKLNLSVNNQLKSVDSLLRFNNLLSSIQTYQLYKINKNTNS